MKQPPIDRFDQTLVSRVVKHTVQDPAYRRLSFYEHMEVSNVLLVMDMLASGQTPDTVDMPLDVFMRRVKKNFLAVYALKQKQAAV